MANLNLRVECQIVFKLEMGKAMLGLVEFACLLHFSSKLFFAALSPMGCFILRPTKKERGNFREDGGSIGGISSIKNILDSYILHLRSPVPKLQVVTQCSGGILFSSCPEAFMYLL